MSLKNRKVEYNGISLTIPQWREKLGIKTVSAWCIYQRIFIHNWPIDLAFKDRRLHSYEKPIRNQSNRHKEKMIDSAVEAVQEMMLFRGYFRKENRIKAYKMLNTWYKEFRAQNMKAA